MSLVRCPHCSGTVQEDPRLAGQLVSCPHCGGKFQMPAPLAVTPTRVPAPVATDQEQSGIGFAPEMNRPVNVLITSPRPQSRLQAGGWFSRAFTTTSGILLAVLLFTVAILGVITLVVCGGCFVVFEGTSQAMKKTVDKIEADPLRLTSTAKRLAIPRLEKYGVVELDNTCSATELLGEVTFAGKAKNTSGRIVSFLITWEVAEFGKEKKWQLKSLIIDGEIKGGNADDL